MKKIIILMFLLLSTTVFAVDKYKIEKTNETEDYKNDKVVVYKFFYYGCSHCMRMEQELHYIKSMENVKFKKIPIVFNDLSKMAAKHYYTAKVLKIEEGFSADYYRNVVLQKNPISDDLAINLMSHYVKKNTILNNINSNLVKNYIESANDKVLEYNIRSTPTYIINGKYKINAEISGGYDNLKEDIMKIINKEI